MSFFQSRLLSSVLAYACAGLLTLVLHESAHGLAALAYGYTPTVYGLHEDDIATAAHSVGVIALAGPIASLVFGALFLAWHRQMSGQGFGRFISLWLGLLGIATALGYLMTAPFFEAGDIAKGIQAFGLPAYIKGVALVVGAIGFVLLGKYASSRVVALTDQNEPLRPQMLMLAPLTWLGGSALVILATLPDVPFTVLAIGTFVPLINLFTARAQLGQEYGTPGAKPAFVRLALLVFIVLILLEQTVFRHGVVL